MLPQLSIALQVRVITDSLAQIPATVKSEDVMFNPSLAHVVVAVALPIFAGMLDASQDIVVFGG